MSPEEGVTILEVKLSIVKLKSLVGVETITISFDFMFVEFTFEDTFSNTAPEDDVTTATNKLVGTAAYLVLGYEL